MPYLIALIVGAVLLAGGAWRINSTAHAKGYHERDLSCAAEKAAIDSQRMEAERQAQAQREKGRILADKAAEEISAMRAAASANNERLNRELKARASASRQCFSGSVASLLNSVTPIRESGSDSATGSAAGRTATPAAPVATSADGSGTSELAAAGALKLARSSFGACREQLRAVLIATDNTPIE
jgi:hypothetical protein